MPAAPAVPTRWQPQDQVVLGRLDQDGAHPTHAAAGRLRLPDQHLVRRHRCAAARERRQPGEPDGEGSPCPAGLDRADEGAGLIGAVVGAVTILVIWGFIAGRRRSS